MNTIMRPVFYQGKRLSPECVTIMYQITVFHVMMVFCAAIIMGLFILSGYFGNISSDLYKVLSADNKSTFSEPIVENTSSFNKVPAYMEFISNNGNLSEVLTESMNNSLGIPFETDIILTKEDDNLESVKEDKAQAVESTEPSTEENIENVEVESSTITPIVNSSSGYVAGTPVNVTSEALDGLVANNYYGYTKEDYDYLLMVIVGEAQHCSVTEQMYVGSVVLNRYYADSWFKYGDTIEDICLAPNQYSCFNGGGAYKTPTETNKQVAAQLLKNGSILPANVIWQSLFKQGDGVYWYFEDTGTYICYNDGMPY